MMGMHVEGPFNLGDLLARMSGNNKKMEPVGPLPKQFEDRIIDQMKRREEIDHMIKRLNAEHDMLYVEIAEAVGVYGKNLEYRDGMICVESDEPRKNNEPECDNYGACGEE